MYIRRKVFSKIGEKTFSTTEFQTQKEFAEKKKSTEKIDGESKKEKALKAATIGGAVVAAGGSADSLASRRVEKFVNKVGDLANMARGNIYQGAERRTIQKGKFKTEIPKLTKEESLKEYDKIKKMLYFGKEDEIIKAIDFEIALIKENKEEMCNIIKYMIKYNYIDSLKDILENLNNKRIFNDIVCFIQENLNKLIS